MPWKRPLNSSTTNITKIYLNTFSVSLISLAQLLLRKLDSSRCNIVNSCTWLQLTTPLKNISFFTTIRVIFQKKTGSSHKLFSFLQGGYFNNSGDQRRILFYSDLWTLIEFLKFKAFLGKECFRISLKRLRPHFDEIKIWFFVLKCGWNRWDVTITSFGFVLSKKTSGTFLSLGLRLLTPSLFSMYN